jgi:phosphohistidine swiveling domain-containing protein
MSRTIVNQSGTNLSFFQNHLTRRLVMSKRNGRRQVARLFGEVNSKPVSPAVLGGKGAGLAELALASVPVPPGFTLVTGVARAFHQHKRLPGRLQHQVEWKLKEVERMTGLSFGDSDKPLLVSVRSGAAVSMPGMMDTVLNIGLNRSNIGGLIRRGGEHFAWDCYRRLLAQFGSVVMGVPEDDFRKIADRYNLARHDELQQLCEAFEELILRVSGQAMLENPYDQLWQAIIAVVHSWDSERAKLYRAEQRIANTGTAVNVQSMVFGNLNCFSCTGVVFSNNVAVGGPGIWGEYLVKAQGEDLVSGAYTPEPLAGMALRYPEQYAELERHVQMLAAKRGEVVEVEFTVEAGKLYILQVRRAKQTTLAAVTNLVHGVWDRKHTKEQALKKVEKAQLLALQTVTFDTTYGEVFQDLCRGLPASPGVAVGVLVTSSRAAVEAGNKPTILWRPDTSPDDLPGMMAAKAMVTAVGGSTSHAAVVARALGKPAVVGADGKSMEQYEGQWVSVDGTKGVVYLGRVPLRAGSDTKEVNLFRKWWAAAAAQSAIPQLRFGYVDERNNFCTLCNDFYLSDALARVCKNTKLAARALELKRQVHVRVAENIAMYLVLASGGELCYAASKCANGHLSPALAKLQAEFDVKLGNWSRDYQVVNIKKLRTTGVEQHKQYLGLTVEVFEQSGWAHTAYGGKKWADIARAALYFLEGKLDHTAFADHAFDLQHNTGSAFDKHDMLDGNAWLLKRQLDAKKFAKTLYELKRTLCQEHPEMSTPVAELYTEAQKLGLLNAPV